jgi:hypothetical protein
MARYLPFVLGVLLIVGLTIPQFQMTDRLSGTNVSAEQCTLLLEKVPKKVGDWHGEDRVTDANVRKTAGAIGAVSRIYRNVRTGEQVDLWLIVGHARDISFHTPDVCYPSAGFEARAKESGLYPMQYGTEGATAPFLTNTFIKADVTGQQLLRVFWSWFNPEETKNEGKVLWEAPHNARWHFGNARALYKMYFTSTMRDPSETADASSCARFAREFIPEVNKALAAVYSGTPGSESKPGEATKPEAAPAASSSTESAASTPATPPVENAAKDAGAPAAKAGAESSPAAEEKGAAKNDGPVDFLFQNPPSSKPESK